MENRVIEKADVIQIARELREQLPRLANPTTGSGRSEWTRAIWQYLHQKQQDEYPTWTLYPSGEPIKGRVAGEYLVDFCLFDPTRGCRIACESEWGDIGRIDWGFDKLRSVKADLKILIFQASHDAVSESTEIFERIKSYLCASHHHHPGHEFYLFLQFDEDQAKLFIWEPTTTGPYDEIVIEPIV